ncbi:MAG: hypothetical protein EBX60_07255 [Betaproteobacteria bacterium]|nr:hypothetical protein [Betaproteobacteria bacterium]
MSNYCKQCAYRPALREGDRACPFTVFYWDFLKRNQALLEKNPRMFHAIRQLKVMDTATLSKNAQQAQRYRDTIDSL